jgi:hypothetical protein
VKVALGIAHRATADKALDRLRARDGLRNATVHELLDPHVNVKANLVIGLAAERFGCIDRKPKRALPALHVARRGDGATVRMSVTASA